MQDVGIHLKCPPTVNDERRTTDRGPRAGHGEGRTTSGERRHVSNPRCLKKAPQRPAISTMSYKRRRAGGPRWSNRAPDPPHSSRPRLRKRNRTQAGCSKQKRKLGRTRTKAGEVSWRFFAMRQPDELQINDDKSTSPQVVRHLASQPATRLFDPR